MAWYDGITNFLDDATGTGIGKYTTPGLFRTLLTDRQGIVDDIKDLASPTGPIRGTAQIASDAVTGAEEHAPIYRFVELEFINLVRALEQSDDPEAAKLVREVMSKAQPVSQDGQTFIEIGGSNFPALNTKALKLLEKTIPVVQEQTDNELSIANNLSFAIGKGEVSLDGYRGDWEDPNQLLEYIINQLPRDSDLRQKMMHELTNQAGNWHNDYLASGILLQHANNVRAEVTAKNREEDLLGTGINPASLVNLQPVFDKANEVYESLGIAEKADEALYVEEAKNIRDGYARSKRFRDENLAAGKDAAQNTLDEAIRKATFDRDENINIAAQNFDAGAFGARAQAGQQAQNIQALALSNPSVAGQLGGLTSGLDRQVQGSLLGDRATYQGDRATANRQFAQTELGATNTHTQTVGELDRIHGQESEHATADVTAALRANALGRGDSHRDYLEERLRLTAIAISPYQDKLDSGVALTPQERQQFDTLTAREAADRQNLNNFNQSRATPQDGGDYFGAVVE